MTFVYFPPGKKQFFFSSPLMHTASSIPLLYSPMSRAARFIWNLVKQYRFIRVWFTIKRNRLSDTVQTILKAIQVTDRDLLQINCGTPGADQKLTLLLHRKNGETSFFKIAQSKRSIQLVENEYSVLLKLNGKCNSPTVKSYGAKNGFLFLETTYIAAHKYNSIPLTEAVFELLIKISSFQLDRSEKLLNCFSHGDFCPWNILYKDTIIYCIDWELAGEYSLGYDLFTYIFQTSFLLNPGKSSGILWEENKEYIHRYFEHFGVNDPITYLSFFVKKKMEYEEEKDCASLLFKKYRELYQNSLSFNL